MMNNIIKVLCMIFFSSQLFASNNNWAQHSGQKAFSFKKKIEKEIESNFLLYLPQNYNSKKQWPLIIFLHGSGERGDQPEKIKVHSLPHKIDNDPNFPFIVLSPQVKENKTWDIEALDQLLTEVISQLKIDKKRIYLTGISRGGWGTWQFAIAHPERFAAIAPVCGWAHPEDVEHLSQMPIWIFHGAKDDVVPPQESERMLADLQKYGNKNVKLTLYPEGNHGIWDQVYNTQELYDWFLKHSLK